MVPSQRLSSQQDSIRAVQHDVGNVGGFRARGTRVGGHAVHHAGDDHRLARKVALLQNHFLDEGHLLHGHVQAEARAREDDGVGVLEDGVEVAQRRDALHLGRHLRVRLVLRQQRLQLLDTLAIFAVGERNEGHLVWNAPLNDVLDVALRQGIHRQILLAHNLHDEQLSAQLRGVVADAHDFRLGDRLHLHVHGGGVAAGKEILAHKDDVARLAQRRQPLVVDGQVHVVAWHAHVRGDGDHVVLFEDDGVRGAQVVLLELLREGVLALDEQLRPARVQHGGAQLARLLHRRLQVAQRLAVVLLVAPRKVEARNGHARVQQLHEFCH
mmetsp:Transcript_25267/g.47778  ORF Transcript_25267/g.47778 Transcript_25267/m.47778 type:complete len:326 (-) Transcript_25267:333-1310(-)